MIPEPHNHDMKSLLEFYRQWLFTDEGRQLLLHKKDNK